MVADLWDLGYIAPDLFYLRPQPLRVAKDACLPVRQKVRKCWNCVATLAIRVTPGGPSDERPKNPPSLAIKALGNGGCFLGESRVLWVSA